MFGSALVLHTILFSVPGHPDSIRHGFLLEVYCGSHVIRDFSFNSYKFCVTIAPALLEGQTD